MEFRTLDGMIGYADGYNLCFKQFCEYLMRHDKDEAVRKMKLLVTAVNSVVSDEQQTDVYDYKGNGKRERSE